MALISKALQHPPRQGATCISGVIYQYFRFFPHGTQKLIADLFVVGQQHDRAGLE